MLEIALGLVGLLAGSLLTEGMVLVPFWRGLAVDRFYDLHGSAGPKLFRYFAPLTAGGVLATIAAAALDPSNPLLVAAALCLLAVLVTFFLFFKAANGRLSAHAYDAVGLAGALRKWAIWHAMRTGFALAGFAALISAH